MRGTGGFVAVVRLGTPVVALAAAALVIAAIVAAATVIRSVRALRDERRAHAAAGARAALRAAACRRVVEAARGSSHAVREAIALGVTELVPAVDVVLIYEESEGELRCETVRGERGAYFGGTRLALDGTSLAAHALSAGHRAVAAITAESARPAGAGVPTRSLLPGDAGTVAVPLRLDEGRRACVVASSRSPLRDADVELVVDLVEDAAPAYALAFEREDDRRRAEYDALTGLLAPRAFRRELARLVERARFSADPGLAVVFIDTDRFKQWNDVYGHACGDALLRALAGALHAVTAPGDLAARNGGDEFCLVFAGSGKAEAVERAETLRRRIAELDVASLRPRDAACAIRITASIGVAAFPADASTAGELLEAADGAMYHSKRTGRDGVSYVAPRGGFTRLGVPARRLESRAG